MTLPSILKPNGDLRYKMRDLPCLITLKQILTEINLFLFFHSIYIYFLGIHIISRARLCCFILKAMTGNKCVHFVALDAP